MSATPMLFRVFKDRGDVIAFIPSAPASRGLVTSYMHVGQHGDADYRGLLRVTRLATEEERAPLLCELRRIYGPIRVLRRMPR